MESLGQHGATSLSQLPSSGQIASSIEQMPHNANITMNPNSSSNNMNNIVLTKNEVVSQNNNQMQNQMQQNPMQQNQMQQQQQQQQNNVINDSNSQNRENYNELVNQLQQASAVGATSLPSRDIPINPNSVNNDVQIKPNFIPESSAAEDYINNMQTPENLIMENNQQQMNLDRLDTFYSEFQLPLLIAVLYFLFQLPVFKRSVKGFLPALFGQDGNPNLYGYFFNSALFATFFYGLLKLINNSF